MTDKTTAPAEVKKEIKIDDRVLELSEKFDKVLTVANDGGTVIDTKVYIDMMPEGITATTAQAHREYDELFAAGLAHRFGMKANKAYAENKELESVTVTVPLSGRDKFTLQSKRHSTHVNPGDRSKTVESYGSLTSITRLSMGDKNVGHFGAVCRLIKEEAAHALRDL